MAGRMLQVTLQWVVESQALKHNDSYYSLSLSHSPLHPPLQSSMDILFMT